jgi:hypothetical protein
VKLFQRALTLALSRWWREKEQNFLTAPLTLVLSSKGRERIKEKILTSPHPTLSRGGERVILTLL